MLIPKAHNLCPPFFCGTFWSILLQLILLLNYKDVLLFCFITMLFCPIVIFPQSHCWQNFNFLPDSDCTATDNSRLWGKIRFWILEKYLNIFWKRSLLFPVSSNSCGATCVTCDSIIGTGCCAINLIQWGLFLFATFKFHHSRLIFLKASVWSQNIHMVVSRPKLEVWSCS